MLSVSLLESLESLDCIDLQRANKVTKKTNSFTLSAGYDSVKSFLVK